MASPCSSKRAAGGGVGGWGDRRWVQKAGRSSGRFVSHFAAKPPTHRKHLSSFEAEYRTPGSYQTHFTLSSPILSKINHTSARRAYLGESSSYDSYPRLPLYPTYTYSSLNRKPCPAKRITGSNGLYSAIRYTKSVRMLGPYRLSKPPNTVVVVWFTRTLSCGQWCQLNAGHLSHLGGTHHHLRSDIVL